MRDFNEWLGKMRQSINGYNYGSLQISVGTVLLTALC